MRLCQQQADAVETLARCGQDDPHQAILSFSFGDFGGCCGPYFLFSLFFFHCRIHIQRLKRSSSVSQNTDSACVSATIVGMSVAVADAFQLPGFPGDPGKRLRSYSLWVLSRYDG